MRLPLPREVRPRQGDVIVDLVVVVGGMAGFAVMVASRFDRLFSRKTVEALADPSRRGKALARAQRRLERAAREGNVARYEDVLIEVVQALAQLGLWSDLRRFASVAPRGGRKTVREWLAGLEALAAMHEEDHAGAASILKEVGVSGAWLESVEALRLAVAGRGEEALARLEGARESRLPTLGYVRALAAVHAYAALGRRDAARDAIRAWLDAGGKLEDFQSPRGPATSLSVSLASPGSPYRGGG